MPSLTLAASAAGVRVPVMELRYEDLCANAPGTVQSVLDFMGVRARSDGLHPIGPANCSAYDDRHLGKVSLRQFDELVGVLSPALARYGY